MSKTKSPGSNAASHFAVLLAAACGNGAQPVKSPPALTTPPPTTASQVPASTEPSHAAEEQPSAQGGTATVAPGNEAVRPSAALPAHTTVLQVGDSFAESLGAPLGRRLQAAGVRSVLETKTPSYIPTWAGTPELERFIQKYRPDLVIVTLGGNEFEIPDPAARIDAVKRLVAHIGDRPCVWITPPRWKADTGVLAVIRDHASPCRYLDSDQITRDLPRGKDKIHPTEAGREQWAEAVIAWLAAERNVHGDRPWSLEPKP